ncbi:uncharacterized protein LOC123525390 [Mercenaria mercenaria]|uniref:uncharacterized protein LOC123525390 n=1 Tax=Mercenaria mercenaria TaxID=6596 RepID=UPI00234F37CD|nr:uncharacterized protein LOC123525390 [Mercenaria mercenaria]
MVTLSTSTSTTAQIAVHTITTDTGLLASVSGIPVVVSSAGPCVNPLTAVTLVLSPTAVPRVAPSTAGSGVVSSPPEPCGTTITYEPRKPVPSKPGSRVVTLSTAGSRVVAPSTAGSRVVAPPTTGSHGAQKTVGSRVELLAAGTRTLTSTVGPCLASFTSGTNVLTSTARSRVSVSTIGTHVALSTADTKSLASTTSVLAPLVKQDSDKTPLKCSQCNRWVTVDEFTQHLLNYHAEVSCDTCGKKFRGEFALFQHIEETHVHLPLISSATSTVITEAVPIMSPPLPIVSKSVSVPKCDSPGIGTSLPITNFQDVLPPLTVTSPLDITRPQPVSWESFLPKQFKNVLQKGDLKWVAQCIYDSAGKLKATFEQNWYLPPEPKWSALQPPDPYSYFRQRLFVWAPMRMWGIPLKCPTCKIKLVHGGIYPKAREVIDIDSRYYLVGEYLRCSKCKMPQCPWSSDKLTQLDSGHRNVFPAILTTRLALDRKCVSFMKPRTLGNSSSYLKQAVEEIHSEDWGRRAIQYMSACELHQKGCRLTGNSISYQPPPSYRPLPLAQWFETVHANEVLLHASEMRGSITSTYGKILKLDSTKKVTKKLAGGIEGTAAWMTNVSNEIGEVLNCVLTTGEGAGLMELCQGLVKRYRDADEPEPLVIYVDRDCCSDSGVAPVLRLFQPWESEVRLDTYHFMRRFTRGLTTEHHPLYGTFCSKLSSCIFEWDKGDISMLRRAKKGELKDKFGRVPSEEQISAHITTAELARHCRRKTRGVQKTRTLIDQLLNAMWDLTDSTGVRLVNADSMKQVWETQQKHLPCIQDVSGVELYTKVNTVQKGGQELDVLRCARGSSSLESFHRHQCSFIPGWRSNAMHTQMYMLEGCSRWNISRAREAVDLSRTSQTTMFDIQTMSNINRLSSRVLGLPIIPEFTPPGVHTGERIAVEYLLSQSGKGELSAEIEEEIGAVLPARIEENTEDELLDVTICEVIDIEPTFKFKGLIPVSTTTTEGLQKKIHQETTPSEQSITITPVSISTVTTTEQQVPIIVVPTVCPPPKEQSHSTRPVSPPAKEPNSISQTQVEQTASPSSISTEDIPLPSDGSDSDSSIPLGSAEQRTRYDTRGNPGWEAVDNLAAYLVGLNRSITALSISESSEIVRLYGKLNQMDKSTQKYSLKSKKSSLHGPWRASRKRSGSAPGQQAAERLFMVHGQAAQKPDSNRISECVCLRLSKEFEQARNRPKDNSGKTLPIPHSIVKVYSHIQQLLQDSRQVQNDTNLVLVTINTTTVSAWLNSKQKKADRDSLLQGVALLPQVSVAKEPLLKSKERQTEQSTHGHRIMEFEEQPNREGEVPFRRRKTTVTATATTPSLAASTEGANQAISFTGAQDPYDSATGGAPGQSSGWGWTGAPGQSYGWTGAPGQYGGWMGPNSQYGGWAYQPWSYYGYPWQQPWYPQQPQHTIPPPRPPPPPPSQPSEECSAVVQPSRQREWRQARALTEDEQRHERGEPPKKRRYMGDNYHYQCTKCGKYKSKQTGHTQLKGRWYCPSSGETLEQWKERIINKD